MTGKQEYENDVKDLRIQQILGSLKATQLYALLALTIGILVGSATLGYKVSEYLGEVARNAEAQKLSDFKKQLIQANYKIEYLSRHVRYSEALKLWNNRHSVPAGTDPDTGLAGDNSARIRDLQERLHLATKQYVDLIENWVANEATRGFVGASISSDEPDLSKAGDSLKGFVKFHDGEEWPIPIEIKRAVHLDR